MQIKNNCGKRIYQLVLLELTWSIEPFIHNTIPRYGHIIISLIIIIIIIIVKDTENIIIIVLYIYLFCRFRRNMTDIAVIKTRIPIITAPATTDTVGIMTFK